MPALDVLCQLLETCTISLGLLYAYFVCSSGCLELIPFLLTSWTLCYNQIARTAISVPLDKL